MRPLVWLRTDLRARDNTPLHTAASDATRGVVAIYLIQPDMWREHDESPRKIAFRLRCLRELSETLAKRNIALLVRSAPALLDAADALLGVAREHGCDAVFFNRQFEVNEQIRDAEVAQTFVADGRGVRSFTDEVVQIPGDVRTKAGDPYTVFTPFKRRWIERAKGLEIATLGLPKKQAEMVGEPDELPERVEGFEDDLDPDLWSPGESAAHRRLKYFIEHKADEYENERDFPAIDATSRLSVYLNSGVLSTRQCLVAAMEANKGRLDAGSKGLQGWISELIWREFYRGILHDFPRVSKHRPFREDAADIEWSDDEDAFDKWKQGRTGFPIVDAAMRQMNATGWMHNRLRMIVAMFLTKNLWLDWRWGEAHFMRSLVDGDLASNNGGWQWSASTGTDAQPYFRVFNPVSQSERFDPEGEFIREYCPELKPLAKKQIHEPPRDARADLEYPEAIVDHKTTRKQAIERFRAVVKS
jgi:deoxyribodipyrimidine photo-lyase